MSTGLWTNLLVCISVELWTRKWEHFNQAWKAFIKVKACALQLWLHIMLHEAVQHFSTWLKILLVFFNH